jgi:hypothetical protein
MEQVQIDIYKKFQYLDSQSQVQTPRCTNLKASVKRYSEHLIENSHVQSSRASLRVNLKFETSRRARANKASIIKEIPTPRLISFWEGGFTKFGGSPLGLGANGIVERLVPGGGRAKDIFQLDK